MWYYIYPAQGSSFLPFLFFISPPLLPPHPTPQPLGPKLNHIAPDWYSFYQYPPVFQTKAAPFSHIQLVTLCAFPPTQTIP